MQQLVWAFEPSFVEPYTWFLIAVAAIALVRAGLLSWLLGGVPRRRLALDHVLDVSADDFARAALAKRVWHDVPPEARAAQRGAVRRVDRDSALRALRAADARFDYLWRRLAISVSSTWDLMRLTLLVAAFIAAYGLFPTWEYLSFGDDATNATVAGLPVRSARALYDATEYVLARLSLGLGLAGGLCLAAMVFDGLLQRRLASWKRFYATSHDALSGGDPRQAAEV